MLFMEVLVKFKIGQAFNQMLFVHILFRIFQSFQNKMQFMMIKIINVMAVHKKFKFSAKIGISNCKQISVNLLLFLLLKQIVTNKQLS